MKIEDLKGEDNWRTGRGRNGSQVGQVLFYLLAVQLKCIKEDTPPRQLLGVHIEGDEVYCMTILLLLKFQMVTVDVIVDDGGNTGVVCLCPSARHQLASKMFECCNTIHHCSSATGGSGGSDAH